MIETIIITLIFAKWKKYDIKCLLSSKWFYPIFLAEFLMLIMQGQMFLHNYSFVSFGTWVKSIYMILYILPIFRYKLYYESIFGSFLVISGTLMNKIVMSTNGNMMPIYPTLSKLTGYFTMEMLELSPIHILASSDTKLFWLCDYIDIGYSILSIGDIIIRAFIGIVFYYSIKAINSEKEDLHDRIR